MGPDQHSHLSQPHPLNITQMGSCQPFLAPAWDTASAMNSPRQLDTLSPALGNPPFIKLGLCPIPRALCRLRHILLFARYIADAQRIHFHPLVPHISCYPPAKSPAAPPPQHNHVMRRASSPVAIHRPLPVILSSPAKSPLTPPLQHAIVVLDRTNVLHDRAGGWKKPERSGTAILSKIPIPSERNKGAPAYHRGA